MTISIDVPTHSEKVVKAKVVPFTTPRHEMGLYWGYRVRIARAFKDVFHGSVFGGKYDLTIGTSDKGQLCVRFGV